MQAVAPTAAPVPVPAHDVESPNAVLLQLPVDAAHIPVHPLLLQHKIACLQPEIVAPSIAVEVDTVEDVDANVVVDAEPQQVVVVHNNERKRPREDFQPPAWRIGLDCAGIALRREARRVPGQDVLDVRGRWKAV